MKKLLCVCFYIILNKQIDAKMHEKFYAINVIKSNGYPTETYELETEDGYLLDLYRVPHGKKTFENQPNQHPILLVHGMMGSSENFIYGGPKKAIAYMLADQGFDVWLYNARGSVHSRKHKRMNPDTDTDYWKFTWHEMAVYDLTKIIDYILKTTNKKQLHYMGHSQGTTSFFAMTASKPEYNKKIKLMVALAPIAIIRNLKNPLWTMMVPFYPIAEKLLELLNIYEFDTQHFVANKVVQTLKKNLCGKGVYDIDSCTSTFYSICGFELAQIDPATVSFIVASNPAGFSVKQVFHFTQIVAQGIFNSFDWGEKENVRRYNSASPPVYDLKKVTAPVAIIHAEGDALLSTEDVALMMDALPNVVGHLKILKFTHNDFIIHKDIDIHLNNNLITMIKKYI